MRPLYVESPGLTIYSGLHRVVVADCLVIDWWVADQRQYNSQENDEPTEGSTSLESLGGHGRLTRNVVRKHEESAAGKERGTADGVDRNRLEDLGRDERTVAHPAHPKHDRDSSDASDDEARDYSAVVPRFLVAAPLQSENEAGDRAEDEGRADPVHPESLMQNVASRPLAWIGPERQRRLEHDRSDDERNSSDREVDVAA